MVYKAGTSKVEVQSFPLRPNKRTGKGFTHGIGCVDETPSPAWYAIKIEESGNLLMNISHSEGADIDFVCWGPFSGETKQAMLENVCGNADSYFDGTPGHIKFNKVGGSATTDCSVIVDAESNSRI